MTHNETRELLGPYALDALGPIDRVEVRAHLGVCDACEKSLREYQEVASHLALMAETAQPPGSLRSELMKEAASTRQSLPVGIAPKRWLRTAGSGLLAGAAVLLIGVLVGVSSARFSAQDRVIPEVAALLSSPNVNSVPMTPTARDPDASGTVFMPPEGNVAALIMTGLDDPGRGFYRVAAVFQGHTLPLKTFQPDRSGLAVVLIRSNLSSADEVVVLLDRAGTSPRVVLRSS